MKPFTVIDNETGNYPDCEKIALTEEWAKGLIYCDIDEFAITEDGNLILMDDCGNCAYCPADRFTIVFESEVTKMPDKKITDNEIIKALECCADYCNCIHCECREYCPKSPDELMELALDLINRLQSQRRKEQNKNRKLRNKINQLKAEVEEVAYKLGCLLCHATGGKLSKHTYPLSIMESYVNDTIQDYCEEATEEAKAEAYKEFAEEIFELFPADKPNTVISRVTVKHILKELVGGHG